MPEPVAVVGKVAVKRVEVELTDVRGEPRQLIPEIQLRPVPFTLKVAPGVEAKYFLSVPHVAELPEVLVP